MKKDRAIQNNIADLISQHPVFQKIRGEFVHGKDSFALSGIPSWFIPYALDVCSQIFSGSFLFLTHMDVEYREITSKSNMHSILKEIAHFGLDRVESVEKGGEYSLIGDSLILWGYGYQSPCRIEFWGDSVEAISLIDEVSKRKIANLSSVLLISGSGIVVNPQKKFSGVRVFYGVPNAEFNFDFKEVPSFHENATLMEKYIESNVVQGKDIVLATLKKDKTNITPRDNVYFLETSITRGFQSSALGLVVLGDYELFDTIIPVPEHDKQADFLEIQNIEVGDYIVHKNHGVAVYGGVEVIDTFDSSQEYFVLKYAKGDKLFVPRSQLALLTKYIGTGKLPRLTRLGTQDWENVRKKARKSIQSIAKELLELYAIRETRAGYKFSQDTDWQKELERSFPFDETSDQTVAWQEIKEDMESERPMDRLVVGDVGFGKTELAIRAAFKAAQDGKQVVVLAPTTVLVEQHYSVFRERLKDFPVDIDALSRFKSEEEISRVLSRLEMGITDIVIGTHRLLSQDVKIQDIGLLIVDEEQRFGVKQKEKLKKLRAEVDILSMSATPIPRSLSMALSGIRDVSTLMEPPKGRKPIETYLKEFDYAELIDAVTKEVERRGQVYLVHNKIKTIESFTNELRKRSPKIRFIVAHGQMHGDSLSDVMREFNAGKYDVLVCTTIIENGLDMPNVNTIIIDDAHRFGLSQLHQLRGRVGRAKRKSYCYLFYPKGLDLDSLSGERISTIHDAQDLGAGFRIATKDLELRGAGNLLGREQSGSIYSVGYALYVQLLKGQIRRLRRSQVNENPSQRI